MYSVVHDTSSSIQSSDSMDIVLFICLISITCISSFTHLSSISYTSTQVQRYAVIYAVSVGSISEYIQHVLYTAFPVKYTVLTVN